jgi:RNA polymerase sigma-70 factor (ECF subfamily)
MRAEHLARVLDHLALLDRLSRRLRAYYKGKLARIGRGAAEAEDLVQEAILAPWLHPIARYKLIDHLRSNKMSRMDVPIDDHQELMARDDHARRPRGRTT